MINVLTGNEGDTSTLVPAAKYAIERYKRWEKLKFKKPTWEEMHDYSPSGSWDWCFPDYINIEHESKQEIDEIEFIKNIYMENSSVNINFIHAASLIYSILSECRMYGGAYNILMFRIVCHLAADFKFKDMSLSLIHI